MAAPSLPVPWQKKKIPFQLTGRLIGIISLNISPICLTLEDVYAII
jgi:hypothetical protein